MRTSCLIVSIALVGLGTPTAWAQIPSGFELVRITWEPQYYDSFPRMNDCGQIVFGTRLGSSWSLSEIFTYDNGLVRRITNNGDRDVVPDINRDGTVTWSRAPGEEGAREVVVWKNYEVRVVSGPGQRAHSGVINSGEHLAWMQPLGTGCWEADADIVYYDGDETRYIHDQYRSNQSASINDSNTVVWTRYNFCFSRRTDWESEILYWSGGPTESLTSEQRYPTSPRVNNRGQVTWGGREGAYLWEGGPIELIADWARGVTMNDVGRMRLLAWDELEETWHEWYHDGTRFYKLTGGLSYSAEGVINTWGEVAFQSGQYPESDIYHMRRIRNGESDFDGDVDLDDAASLHDCLTGPGDFDRLCDCRFLDIDHDRDVDLGDFVLFQRNYTGSK
jgi:hypothetical protein